MKATFITSKLNAVQFEQYDRKTAGVIFVYTNANGVQTAQHFSGTECTVKDKSKEEVFRVIKNIMTSFWNVKKDEVTLREHNDGIRSKLRANTPTAIIVNDENNQTVRSFELSESIWDKIGLVPTKKDLERSVRDYKKSTHYAAQALFKALNYDPSNADNDVRIIVEDEALNKAQKAVKQEDKKQEQALPKANEKEKAAVAA